METNQKLVCYRGKETETWCTECPEYKPERRQGERRQTRRVFRWLEKRTGFDKRRSDQTSFDRLVGWPRQYALAMREKPRLLIKVLVLFNVYNLADYILTVNALAAGHSEMNPVMRSLFDLDPLAAGAFKISTGIAVTLLVWKFRQFRLILQFAFLSLIGYVGLIFYQLSGIYLSAF